MKTRYGNIAPDVVTATGWSQSAGYLIRYINDFVYRDKFDTYVYDGFLAAGPP